MKIQDTVAFVTGSNRGIGKALVLQLLDSGARKVYAAARSSQALAELQALDPVRVRALQLDVTDSARVEALSSHAPDVNVLVNNAGVLATGPILDVPLDSVQRDLDVNFYGKLRMARAFAPVIERNGGGAIINILTLISLASYPHFSGYCASKAAAWSMTQSLRAQLAGKGITVHGVFPAGVDTDMLAGYDMVKAKPADVARAVVAGLLVGQEDIFPDPLSTEVYAAWKQDHKAVEKQFASM